MNKGYFGIALHYPQKGHNIGSAMRACGCFGAQFCIIQGKFNKESADTKRMERQIPVWETEDIFQNIPYNCIPVAVDLIEGAQSLERFAHPSRAIYIFGSEGETLPKHIVDRCPIKLVIPSNGCLNLAASVNVVLYDRVAKSILK